MKLDIRVPMGVLFTTLGLLLAIYGALSSPEIYQKSLGINVDLIWGLVMAGFGLAMLLLADHAAKVHTAVGPTIHAMPG